MKPFILFLMLWIFHDHENKRALALYLFKQGLVERTTFKRVYSLIKANYETLWELQQTRIASCRTETVIHGYHLAAKKSWQGAN